MYWRRFALSDIPLDDPDQFDVWLRDRWTEKDDLLEQYLQTGRFPADEEGAENGGFIETEVQQKSWWEFTQIFVGLAAFGLVARLLLKIWRSVFYGIH